MKAATIFWVGLLLAYAVPAWLAFEFDPYFWTRKDRFAAAALFMVSMYAAGFVRWMSRND